MAIAPIPEVDIHRITLKLKSAGLCNKSISDQSGVPEKSVENYAQGKVSNPGFENVRLIYNVAIRRLSAEELAE